MQTYLFKSQRLGFRNWKDSDIPKVALLNSDPLVMEYFPETLSEEKTREFVARMQQQYEHKGFCYFMVEKLETAEFIGFIGIAEPTYESAFTPGIDIGWRIAQKEWNKGFATEGAKRCLEYAFNTLKVPRIFAVCPLINKRSVAVMQKIGMKEYGVFEHPLLEKYEHLRTCVVYEIFRE